MEKISLHYEVGRAILPGEVENNQKTDALQEKLVSEQVSEITQDLILSPVTIFLFVPIWHSWVRSYLAIWATLKFSERHRA